MFIFLQICSHVALKADWFAVPSDDTRPTPPVQSPLTITSKSNQEVPKLQRGEPEGKYESRVRVPTFRQNKLV